MTQLELARFSGVPIAYVNAAECLRKIPDWAIKKLADYFECEPQSIFPESFQTLKRNWAIFAHVDVEDIAKLKDRIEDVKQLNSPEKIVQAAERHEQVGKILTTLNTREAQIINLRFGLDSGYPRTLEEVGKIMNVVGARVRQIEARAIRKLRHPSRSRLLRQLIP